jgi:hypothetical protein
LTRPFRPELFHEIAHKPSAQARQYVMDNGLEKQVRFRNIFYPEVQADFAARGGTLLPALWDGERLFQGAEAVLARLAAMMNIGRDG